MSILYRYGNTYYINLTNKCPCRCVFCVRNDTDRLGDADTLWLSDEPTADQVINELKLRDLSKSREIVFCGYGEPTERLDVLLDVAKRIHSDFNLRVRLDTNGLGNLINGRDIVPDLAKAVDAVSISLNASDEHEYLDVTKSKFGIKSYDEVLKFIKECRTCMDSVTVSVVGGSISEDSENKCRTMAREMNVAFRVR